NFYVTETEVASLDGLLHGRTLYVSFSLCRILDLNEFRAVLAHELAHYKGLDTRFSREFYPIYRGAAQGIVNVRSTFSGRGVIGRLVLLPAIYTLSYFLRAFAESERRISRERELAADSAAANYTDRKSAAA